MAYGLLTVVFTISLCPVLVRPQILLSDGGSLQLPAQHGRYGPAVLEVSRMA